MSACTDTHLARLLILREILFAVHREVMVVVCKRRALEGKHPVDAVQRGRAAPLDDLLDDRVDVVRERRREVPEVVGDEPPQHREGRLVHDGEAFLGIHLPVGEELLDQRDLGDERDVVWQLARERPGEAR